MRKIAALIALVSATSACAQSSLPKDVQAVIDRTRSSHASYAVFTRADVTVQGVPHQEVDVEFNQGPMHRVEVPARRVLANCDTGEGAVYDVQSSRYVDDERGDIKGACGISMEADTVRSAKMLPPVSGPYGRADRIELTGDKFVRTYTVTPDGIILANEYRPRTAAVGFNLRTTETVLKRGSQDPSMFTRESLKRAFTPDAISPRSSDRP